MPAGRGAVARPGFCVLGVGGGGGRPSLPRLGGCLEG